MSFLKANRVAGLCVRDGGVKNHLNETVYGYGAPVDYPVCAWWADSEEPNAGGHERTYVTTKLITPTGFPAKPQDRVVLGGKLFEINGYAQNHTNGPWWNPGVVVWTLNRIEGG